MCVFTYTTAHLWNLECLLTRWSKGTPNKLTLCMDFCGMPLAKICFVHTQPRFYNDGLHSMSWGPSPLTEDRTTWVTRKGFWILKLTCEGKNKKQARMHIPASHIWRRRGWLLGRYRWQQTDKSTVIDNVRMLRTIRKQLTLPDSF